MPEFESLNHYNTEYNDNLNKNIHQSQSFFSRVLNRVQGSHLPFIFQPDSTKTNPDQWALARFDQGAFSLSQTAHNVYDISLKIREVW